MSAAPRIDTLPKWAQNLLRQLQEERDAARAQVRALLGEERSRVLLDPHWDQRPQRYLKDTDSVRFVVSDRDERYWIEVRLAEDAVGVMASGPMLITPHVTNRLDLSLRDF